MNKLVFTIAISILSSSALAESINWQWIPIPNGNQYQQANQNSYQQLQDNFNGIIDSFSKKNETKSTNYSNIGNFTYGSDGSSSYNTEDRSYGSNGVNGYQMNENSGYYSNGSTYSRVGDFLYINNPDGSRTVCYVSSDQSTTCR